MEKYGSAAPNRPRYAPPGHDRCKGCGRIKRAGGACARCDEQAAQDVRRASVWPGTKCLFNGRGPGMKGRKARPVVRGDGKRYASIAEASIAITGDVKASGGISCACRGQRKQALGYTWRFDDETEEKDGRS